MIFNEARKEILFHKSHGMVFHINLKTIVILNRPPSKPQNYEKTFLNKKTLRIPTKWKLWRMVWPEAFVFKCSNKNLISSERQKSTYRGPKL